MIRVMAPHMVQFSVTEVWPFKGDPCEYPNYKKLVKPQGIVGLFLQHITWGSVLLCITTDDQVWVRWLGFHMILNIPISWSCQFFRRKGKKTIILLLIQSRNKTYLQKKLQIDMTNLLTFPWSIHLLTLPVKGKRIAFCEYLTLCNSNITAAMNDNDDDDDPWGDSESQKHDSDKRTLSTEWWNKNIST